MEEIYGADFSELYTIFSLMITSQLHGDYIIFGNATTETMTTLCGISGLNQIAMVRTDRMLENTIELKKTHLEREKFFDSLGIFFLTGIQESTWVTLFTGRDQCSACTWLFLHENLLSQSVTNFHLMDKILFLDSQQKPFEIYGIKGRGTIKRRIPNTEQDFSLSIRNRLNFGGTCLEVAHVMQPNLITISGQETLKSFPHDFPYDVLAYTQDLFGFTARFHNVSNWVWAPPNVTSMAELIESKDADIAMTSTALFRNDNLYRFIIPYEFSTEIYIFYQSKHLPMRARIYEGIIRKTNLVCSLLGMIVLIILMSFCFYRNTRESTIMRTVAIFTGQGVDELTVKYRIPNRILTIVILVFQLLSFTVLSSYLVASLSFTKQIKSLQDLTDRGITEFGFEEKSIVEDAILAGSPGSILWDIRDMFKPYQDGGNAILDVLRNQKLAYIDHQDKHCGDLNQLVIHGQKRYGGAFVHTMSEFAEPFNYAGIKMFETGLAQSKKQQGKKRRQDVTSKCMKPQIFEPGIHFEDIRLTYYILVAGTTLAVIGVVIEILRDGITKHTQRNGKRRNKSTSSATILKSHK